jgi:hypothetical protein
MKTHTWLTALVLGASLFALAPRAQEGEEDDGKLGVAEQMQQGGGNEEIAKLFQEIDESLREIDGLLWDASAGEPPEGAEDPGIGKLLEAAQDRSDRAIEAIDRILELASQNSGNVGQGGGGQPMPEPGPGQQGRQESEQPGAPGEREATPEAGPQQGQEQQQGEGQGQDQQDQPNPDGEPHSPGDSEGSDDESRAGGKPRPQETGPGSDAEGAERWGELPQRVREVFRSEGGRDMPARYREWIDAYYRRLNRSE